MNAGEETRDGASMGAAASVEEMAVEPALLRRRVERLGESAVCAGMYSTPVLFVLLAVFFLIVDRRPDVGVLAHVMDSLGSAAFGAVACGVAVWFGISRAVAHYRESTELLARRGRVVEARRSGPPMVFGSQFLTYTISWALGMLSEPLAPLLGRKLPLFQVPYSFEVDGRVVRTCELFYGDEDIVEDEEGRGRVLVDEASPATRHWLLRKPGRLAGVPFREEEEDASTHRGGVPAAARTPRRSDRLDSTRLEQLHCRPD